MRKSIHGGEIPDRWTCKQFSDGRSILGSLAHLPNFIISLQHEKCPSLTAAKGELSSAERRREIIDRAFYFSGPQLVLLMTGSSCGLLDISGVHEIPQTYREVWENYKHPFTGGTILKEVYISMVFIAHIRKWIWLTI